MCEDQSGALGAKERKCLEEEEVINQDRCAQKSPGEHLELTSGFSIRRRPQTVACPCPPPANLPHRERPGAIASHSLGLRTVSSR